MATGTQHQFLPFEELGRFIPTTEAILRGEWLREIWGSPLYDKLKEETKTGLKSIEFSTVIFDGQTACVLNSYQAGKSDSC
jgi:hypothetical protein